MNEDYHLVVNVTLPKDVAQKVQTQTPKGVHIESARNLDEEETSRFGIAEATALVALVRGILELVQLAVEIWKMLQERAKQTGQPNQGATLTAPDGLVRVEISATLKREELEKLVQQAFAASK
jgi:hypothetical protein